MPPISGPSSRRAGDVFKGHSDTEVIVEAIAEWGVEPTVEAPHRHVRLRALGPAHAHSEPRARPARHQAALFRQGTTAGLLFASELKAFEVLPGWSPELDRDALASYHAALLMCRRRTPIYRGIAKLMPGQIADDRRRRQASKSRASGVSREAAERGKANQLDLDDSQAIDMLETLLGDAVGRRLVADVPLGAFLSGGIDSSTVAAMMRMKSNAPVRTYSIGFNEQGYDEAPHARAVAAHLGTEHTELYVSPAEAQDVDPAAAEHL